MVNLFFRTSRLIIEIMRSLSKFKTVFLTNNLKYFLTDVSVNAVMERNSYIKCFQGMVDISNL